MTCGSNIGNRTTENASLMESLGLHSTREKQRERERVNTSACSVDRADVELVSQHIAYLHMADDKRRKVDPKSEKCVFRLLIWTEGLLV